MRKIIRVKAELEYWTLILALQRKPNKLIHMFLFSVFWIANHLYNREQETFATFTSKMVWLILLITGVVISDVLFELNLLFDSAFAPDRNSLDLKWNLCGNHSRLDREFWVICIIFITQTNLCPKYLYMNEVCFKSELNLKILRPTFGFCFKSP